jgi:transposase InsO family protein
MMASLRREAYRWLVLGWVQVRVWRARRMTQRANMLTLDAAWERQECQQLLDVLPPSLFRRGEGGGSR